MDQYLYSCQYCGKDYKPNRRFKQKFCSNSCRTNAFKLKNKNTAITNPGKPIERSATEKMSWAGVGNAAAGTLAADLAMKIFTSEESKPATKKDLKELETKMRVRYFPIKNLPTNIGSFPYFDTQTQNVIYLKQPIK